MAHAVTRIARIRAVSGAASALGLLVLGGLFGGPCAAQSGGPYLLRASTFESGGSTSRAAAPYRVGDTIGQADAGVLAGGIYRLDGGFWERRLSGPPPTATATVSPTTVGTPLPTRTATRTATASRPPTATASRVNSVLPTPTRTPPTAAPGSPSTTATRTVATSPTATGAMPTPSAPVSASPTPTSTPPRTPRDCPGDCDGDGQVTVDEVIRGVNITLGDALLATCQSLDRNVDGRASIDELITAVRAVSDGCPAAAAPTMGAAPHFGDDRVASAAPAIVRSPHPHRHPSASWWRWIGAVADHHRPGPADTPGDPASGPPRGVCARAGFAVVR